MRSTTSRLTVALVAALTFVAPFVLMPTPPVWADDDVDIDIDDLEKVKRGEKKVMFRADVEKADLICTLSIKYADGDTDTVGNDESVPFATEDVSLRRPSILWGRFSSSSCLLSMRVALSRPPTRSPRQMLSSSSGADIPTGPCTP